MSELGPLRYRRRPRPRRCWCRRCEVAVVKQDVRWQDCSAGISLQLQGSSTRSVPSVRHTRVHGLKPLPVDQSTLAGVVKQRTLNVALCRGVDVEWRRRPVSVCTARVSRWRRIVRTNNDCIAPSLVQVCVLKRDHPSRIDPVAASPESVHAWLWRMTAVPYATAHP
jgi:hypothetical protein